MAIVCLCVIDIGKRGYIFDHVTLRKYETFPIIPPIGGTVILAGGFEYIIKDVVVSAEEQSVALVFEGDEVLDESKFDIIINAYKRRGWE
jgi:hypothetical protein